MIISYPASPSRIIVLLKTLRPRIENLNQKQMKERNVEEEKTVKWKHLLITWLNEKGAKTLDVLQCFWEKLNEFNESILEESRSFIFGKIALFYWLSTVVNGQCFCKSGWNGFHMDVRAEKSEFVIY